MLILFSLVSCAATKNSDPRKTNATSKIFMGVFNVTRSATDSTIISVVLKKHFWAEGEIQEISPTSSAPPHQLTFIFLDQNKRILKTHVVSNPLRQDFEYYAASGKLEKKTVSLASAPIMIRTQMTTNLKMIKVVDHEDKLLSLITVTP